MSRELLDSAAPDPVAAAEEFRFLRRMNRVTATSTALVDAIERRLHPAPGQVVSLVDFGAGAGDVAFDTVRMAGRRGWTIAPTLTDHSEVALQAARARMRDLSEARFGRFDLLGDQALPEGAPFLVSHASLVLHHLSDAGVVRALGRMSDCTSGLVVWNDLVRDGLGVLGARLSTLAHSPTLRHDAVLSVRRSFTLAEARAFAEAAGLLEIDVRRWRGARFVLTARPSPAHGAAAAPRPLIRARGLSFSFGVVSASASESEFVFRDRSFVLRSGEIGLAAGPNGSGKTTTLRLLAGVLAPTSGDAWSDTSEGPVGYLPQRGGLIASLTVGANIDALQRVAGVASRERERRARAAIERFGIGSIASRPIAALSVGQSRRAAIASVWATAGRVLLLDEPDAGLDADGRERLGLALNEHARGGGAALVASHEWTWLERACDAGGIPLARSVGR